MFAKLSIVKVFFQTLTNCIVLNNEMIYGTKGQSIKYRLYKDRVIVVIFNMHTHLHFYVQLVTKSLKCQYQN